jgi:hypothetical protein
MFFSRRLTTVVAVDGDDVAVVVVDVVGLVRVDVEKEIAVDKPRCLSATDTATLADVEVSEVSVHEVQSLETDFRPSMECVGEAAEAATAATAATFDMTSEVDKSRGLSSRTLSTRRLKSVCRRYWMAGRRNASSGRSGTKKATSSVLGPTSLTRSKTGSPVGPFVATTLTSSL